MPEPAPEYDLADEPRASEREGDSSQVADADELDWPPCPSWCEHVQCREQDARDRLHQVARLIPVIVNEGGISSVDVLATDMWVAIYTDVNHHGEIWVHLSDGEHFGGITMTLESARRIVRGMYGCCQRSTAPSCEEGGAVDRRTWLLASCHRGTRVTGPSGTRHHGSRMILSDDRPLWLHGDRTSRYSDKPQTACAEHDACLQS